MTISQIGDGKIEVVAHIAFSGRYLKYLYVEHAERRRPFLMSLPQDQEVPEEAATPRLAARRIDKQGCVRVEVLQRGQ